MQSVQLSNFMNHLRQKSFLSKLRDFALRFLVTIICLEQIPLFSIVHFPNEECTSTSSGSSSSLGTCFTSSECTSKSGTAKGSCAFGFGVCCVISSSTCGSTVSTNITYIRNPGYPGSITPTSTGTCSFTIDKASDDICQLREGLKIF